MTPDNCRDFQQMPLRPISPPSQIGARLVRLLRMRVPQDLRAQHVQEAFAFLQSAAAVFVTLQAAVVAAWVGTDTLPAQIRIANNLVAGVCTAVLLLTVTRAGHVVWSARIAALVVVAYQGVISVCFGLIAMPGTLVIAMPVLAGLVMTESTNAAALWGLGFAALAAYGVLVEPLFVVAATPVPVAISVFVTVGFFTLYIVEYRQAMQRIVDQTAQAATDLAERNAELRAAIAERDVLAGRLETAQRLEAMGRVAGGIAHDFNNLLTVIRGYGDLLARAIPEQSPHAEDARQLQRALVRAGRVTQDILDFARPKPTDRALVDLAEFVRDAGPELTTAAGAAHPLLFRVADGPVVIEANRGQIERLLVNLVLNARDASPAGAPIRLEVGRAGDAARPVVHISVSDRGPGVPEELRERIFEPFYTTKGTTGGTGLGLATSYALVQQHGGTLYVENRPDGGARFVAEFPAADANAKLPRSSGDPEFSPLHGRPLDGMRALVVEDDPGVRAITERLLRSAGADVESVEHAADGLATMRRYVADASPLQLVVSDLRLPVGSGKDVLRAARAQWPAAALVAISGFLEDDDVAAMAAARDVVFLSKPFTAERLIAAVEQARQRP
jgi:signal transduction histidine kinase